MSQWSVLRMGQAFDIDPIDYYNEFKKLNDILSDADKLYHMNPAGEIDLTTTTTIEYYKHQPGDKAKLTNSQTWTGKDGSFYTVPEDTIIVIRDESPDLPDHYRFHHDSDPHQDALVHAKWLKPVSSDTPHICYCPKDTVIHYGCKCKGV